MHVITMLLVLSVMMVRLDAYKYDRSVEAVMCDTSRHCKAATFDASPDNVARGRDGVLAN